MMYFDVKVLNAPLQGFFVAVKEDVQAVSTDGTASVEDPYRLVIIVARYAHLHAERIVFVRCHKGVAWLYSVTAGCNAV